MAEPGDPCLLNLQPAFSDLVMRISELGPSPADLSSPDSPPLAGNAFTPATATPTTEDSINCLREIRFLAIRVLFLVTHSRMDTKNPLRVDPAQSRSEERRVGKCAD